MSPRLRRLFSTLSGKLVPDGTGAYLRIMWLDSDKPDLRATLTDEETEALARIIGAEEIGRKPDQP